MSLTKSSKVTLGFHPSMFLALVESPKSCSTFQRHIILDHKNDPQYVMTHLCGSEVSGIDTNANFSRILFLSNLSKTLSFPNNFLSNVPEIKKEYQSSLSGFSLLNSLESGLHKLSDAVHFSSGDDKIFWLFQLQHFPHAFDIILGMS